jgi:polygalacturonase/uncharacterized protein YjdB
MKKLFSLMLVLIMAFSFTAPAFAQDPQKVQYANSPKAKAVSLNWNTYAMVGSYDSNNGETITLTATYDAAAYDDPRLEWETGDASIVSLGTPSGNQVVMQARTIGWADITVSLYDGDELIGSDVCAVTVIDNYDRTTFLNLDLSADRLILSEGGAPVEITPVFYPIDFLKINKINTTLEIVNGYNTSVATVALVGGKVVVTPVAAGETSFTIRSVANGKAAACTVTVTDEPVEVTGLTPQTQGVVNLTVGETAQLKVNAGGGEADLIWTSSNAYIASVDQNGVVKGRSTSNYKERRTNSSNLAIGSANDDFQTVDITATSVQGGYTARFQVMVAPLPIQPQSINVNRESETVAVGGADKFLTAAVNPAGIRSPDVMWVSSNEAVLKVESVSDTIFGAPQAKLVPQAAGTATVTASYAELSDTCTVTVTNGVVLVSEIGLQESRAIVVDQVAKLTTNVTSNATNQRLFWLSTNRSVVTVNQEGVIQGYNTFEEPDTLGATIYAFAKDSLTQAQLDELCFTADPSKTNTQQAASNQLGEIRNLSVNSDDMSRLQAILDAPNVVFERCGVTVANSSPYLRNLHIPEETITSNTVALLWNRASLYVADDLVRSEVYVNDTRVATLDNEMSYTVKGLDPNTSYTFKVTTYYGDGGSVSESIRTKTKPAPVTVLNVQEAPYNAVGDGSTLDTAAIQAAIDACPVGGEVLLPAGHVYYSGALYLKSDMAFRVNGILLGSTDPKDYPRMVTRWEGWRKIYQPASEWYSGRTATGYGTTDNEYSHSSLLTLGVYDEGDNRYTGPYNAKNVVICGSGQINGNGYQLGFNEGPNSAANTGGQNGASPKTNATIRGRTLTLHNAQNVYIADVMIANSPSWTMQIIYSDSVTLDNVAAVSLGNAKTKISGDRHYILNGDGCDVDSSSNVNIVDSYFRAGDDAIASKSGKDFEGWERGKPTAYLRITDVFGDTSRYGIIIGSEMAGGAHDQLGQNLEFKNNESDSSLWIKAPPHRGGLVEDIQYKDIFNNNSSKRAIYAAAQYSDGTSNVPAPVATVIRRLTYENVYDKTGNSQASSIAGSSSSGQAEVFIRDVLILGCSFTKATTLTRASDIRSVDTTPNTSTSGTGVSNVTLLSSTTPVAVQWTLTANGTSAIATTTGVALTFNVNPITLSERNITVTGATKGVLSGTGTTRTLKISDITVGNEGEVKVEITRQPVGYAIAPPSKTVTVFDMPAPINQEMSDPAPVSLFANDANNNSATALISYLNSNIKVPVRYGDGSTGEITATWTLSAGTWDRKGGNYTYTFTEGSQSVTLTVGVKPINAAITGVGNKMVKSDTAGFNDLADLKLPSTVAVTYTAEGLSIPAGILAVSWSTIPEDFGKAIGSHTFTGTVVLPDWATGSNATASTVEVVDKTPVAVENISIQIKEYDGNTTAKILGTTPAFATLVLGDVAITGTAIAVFNNPDVGTGKSVTISGLLLTGEDADVYVLDFSDITGDILPKALDLSITSVTKPYDGTTALSIAHLGSNYRLTGIVNSEDVDLDTITGTYATSAAGLTTANITDATLKGTERGNYMLSAPLPSGIPATITESDTTFPVTKVTVSGNAQLEVGSNATYTAAIEPINASIKTVIWSVNDSTVATIDSIGKLTAVKAGTVIVTATANNGVNGSRTVTVYTPSSSNDNPSGGGDTSNPAPVQTPPKVEATNGQINVTAVIGTDNKATAALNDAQISAVIDNAASGKAEVKIDAPAGVRLLETTVPAKSIDLAANKGINVFTISSPIASITFDSKTLGTLANNSTGDIKVTMEKVEDVSLSAEAKQIVGDRPVYNFGITGDGKTISQFDGNVSVSLPYTLKPGEDLNAVVIYYINAEGKPEIVRDCIYNASTGSITFSTNHFSQYAVGYNKVNFNDVAANAWYSNVVSFVAARGITEGTGNGNFSPGAKLTRGEFLVMAMKAYGIAPDENPSDNFSDAGNTWYTGYLAAAKKADLTNGIGNNRFGPENKITRQELFTLLYNILKKQDKLPASVTEKTITRFNDAEQIDSWAKEAVSFFVRAGVINGSNGRLTPKDVADRAQMAQILYNMLAQ